MYSTQSKKIGGAMIVRLYFRLFVGGLLSVLRYLCLLAHSGTKHILCC